MTVSKRNIVIVTFALLLSNAMGGIDSTIVNTAMPAIIADLHGIELMGWIVAIFLLGTAISTPLWSKVGERMGNKLAYELAATFFVAGSFLQGIAPNMPFLIITRAIAGLGNGGMVSLPYIIYAELYANPRKRMQVLGLVSASFSTATIIGPLLGGWIVDTFGWHWVFFINVPIGLASAILVQWFFKEKKRAHKSVPVDYAGAVFLSLGLILLLSGTEMIGATPGITLAGMFIAAAILLGILVHVEKRAADPIIPGRLFKNRDLIIDFLLFTIIWGAFMAFLVYAPMWAQALLGASALIGGATQIPGSFTNFGGSGLVAPLRNWLSPQKVIALGTWTLVFTFVIMVLLGQHGAYWWLLVAAALEGFGNGMCFNELQVKVQQDADFDDVPVATSFSYLIRMLSQTFTTAIFGIIMNHALRRGVAASDGRITMKMMNKLSDAGSSASLPVHLLPRMRTIMFTGLHNIMILGLVLMLIAAALNLWALRRENKANVTA
jgi:EmrB/QacA subfamily drug resistance transporter